MQRHAVTGWLYRWLPRLCACHCRADRSFFWKGRQFPVCARCTGTLLGTAAGLALCLVWLPPVWLTVLLMAPMVADGLRQLKTQYESTNPRRLVTGLLFGYGMTAFLWVTGRAAFWLGYNLMK